MLSIIGAVLKTDKRLIIILCAGFVLQMLTSIRAIGVSSMDQHFQIIEFSSYQLGLESAAQYNAELKSKLRPTLQIYLFSAYYRTCTKLGISDPYAQLTLLRLLMGFIMFTVFNLIALWYFRNGPQQILFWVLMLLNFTWIFPYTRTLFSSEMMSGLFFFGSLAFYQYWSHHQKTNLLRALLIGFLFSLSFYFRFQTGFFIMGFGLWLLLVEKNYRSWLPLIAGFALGFLLNMYLDYRFYGAWAITPYNYLEFNIFQDGASNFGTSSVLVYLGLLLAVLPAPFFSFILFYYILKAGFKNYSNPVFLSILFFIIGHSLVPHKEERFFYPFFNALPLLAGWALPPFLNYYAVASKKVRYLLNGVLGVTFFLNTLVLMLFTAIPYAQTIEFAKKVHQQFKDTSAVINCLNRTPYETVSGAPMIFYQKNNKALQYKKTESMDSLLSGSSKTGYFTATYKDLQHHFKFIDSLGYEPVTYSSKLLWNINGFLDAKGKPVINDIWVLYRKK